MDPIRQIVFLTHVNLKLTFYAEFVASDIDSSAPVSFPFDLAGTYVVVRYFH